MLFHILALIIISGCGLLIGNVLLNIIDSNAHFSRAGDRALIAIWLGILFLSNIFLLVSLFLPLTTLVAVCFVLPMLLASLWPQVNRDFIKRLLHIERPKLLAAFLAIIMVSATGSQIIHWYDSGLYHIQVIKWLSEFGLVPGLALLHSRFGFVSSWFTLAAPFNHGILAGRVAALPGSFCMMMLLVSWTIAFFRVMQRQERSQDWFMLAASSLAIPLIVLRWVSVSPSPDLPVMVLIILVGWTILAVADAEQANLGQTHTIMNIRILPLMLSAGAVTIKLSALPLLIVSIIFYLFGRPTHLKIKKLITAMAVPLVFLTPLAAAGIITTGCALYPAPFFCADLPWSLGGKQAAAESLIIRDWARWNNGPTPEGATSLNWIVPWLQADKVFSLLILTTIVLTLLIVVTSRNRLRDRDSYIISIAVIGTAFMFYSAPTWRFGFGYLFIVPALAAAILQHRFEFRLKQHCSMKYIFASSLLGMLILFILPSSIISRYSNKLIDKTEREGQATRSVNHNFNFLLPPRTWNMEYDIDKTTGAIVASPMILKKEQTRDLTYYHSLDGETCWDAPLPCAPGILQDVQLRKPALGIAGGFIKTPSIKETNNE